MEYASAMDDAGDYGAGAQTGLDLVKFYPVSHYGEEPFVQSTAEILKASLGAAGAVVGVLVNLRCAEFHAEALVHAVFPGIVVGAVYRDIETIISAASREIGRASCRERV